MNEKIDSSARIFFEGVRKRLQGQRTRRRRTLRALPILLIFIASVLLTVASYGPAAAQALAPGPGSTGVGIGRDQNAAVNDGEHDFSTDAFYIGNDIVVLDGGDRNALLGFTFSQNGVGTDRSVSLTEIAFTGAQRSFVGLITVQRTSVFGATDQMQALDDAGPLDVEVISRGRIDVTMNDGAVYAGIQTVFVRSSDGDTFLLPDDSTMAFDSWRQTVYTNNSGISSFEIQSTSGADSGFNPLPGDWGDGLFFGPSEVTLSAPSTVAEGGTATITATLSVTSSQDVTVTVNVTDVTTVGDVVTTAVEIVIPAGQTSATGTVPTNPDTIDEGDETFQVSIDNVDSPTGVTGNSAPQTVTITDDDTAQVTLSVDPTVTEGGSATITATLDIASSQDVTVTVNVTDVTTFGDVVTTPVEIVIPAGQTSATGTVPTNPDTINEGDETFEVSIDNVDSPTGAVDNSAPQQIIITDDDAAQVTLSVDPTVSEGGSATITATLDIASSQDVTVTVNVTDVTTAGDVVTTPVEIVIPAGQTSATGTVPTNPDTINEGDETFEVSIDNVDSPTGVTDGSTPQQIIITDDALPSVSFSVDPTVTEGGSATITATLDIASIEPITLTLVYIDVSATGGSDYVTSTIEIVIPAGVTEVPVLVGTNADGITEGDETFQIDVSAIDGSVLDNTSAQTITILDDADGDADGDGVPDSIDLDDDNDGIPDLVEGNGDSDGDGVIDSLDLDSDNDGIPDSLEAGHGLDTNGDGVIDATEAGAGGFGSNGLANAAESSPESGTIGYNGGVPLDSDGDNVPDYLDLDSDNDGVNDVTEAGFDAADSDNDGMIDAVDGADGDGLVGVADVDESTFGAAGTESSPPVDTDGDDVPDHLDLDSDNDGINDVVEAGFDAADADNDGMIDMTGTNDSDGDGIMDVVDGDPATYGDTNDPVQVDSDGDGIPDIQDLDSDNDGINDVVEGGNGAADADNDGVIDSAADTDGDGIMDPVDGDPAVYGDAGDPAPQDSDGDGIPDAQDLDSDNDGINDVIEGGNAADDANNDGIIDGTADTDNDGILDPVDANDGVFGDPGGTPPVDSDSDGYPDFIDIDSDDPSEFAGPSDGVGDDIDDTGNSGYLDANNDGVVDATDDPDGDGIVGPADGQPTVYGDEADYDNDGVPDSIDLDDDNDGIPDSVEGTGDTDGDGVPDYLDLDADGDGIMDLNESGLTPAQIAALDSDSDGVVDAPVGANGLADAIETDDTGAAEMEYDGTPGADQPVDTDGDGKPDFQDLDSDNDGISDLTEGSGLLPSLVDTNNDGVLDDNLTASDSDGDGVPDSIDPTPGSFGGVDQTPVDTDLDGTPDYQDLDSDNDGIHDLVENGLLDPAIVDTNNDGLIDPGVDGDNDGVPDVADTDAGNYGTPQSGVPADTDSDGTPDYQDLDSDNDGIHDLVESGNIDPTVADTDNDGILDDPTVDADGDGIPDSGDTNDGAFGDPQTAPLVDSDGDGVPDVQDLDSDNDSVNDIEEGGNAAADTNGDGMADDPLVDADGDGVPDSIDDAPNTLGDPDSGTAPDSDGEGTPDYIDVDSDDPTDQSGDGTGDDIDIAGNGGLDADGNGTVDDTADPDGDGIPVGSDGAPNNYGELVDLDGDGVEDSLDLDDDNDGIPDAVEGKGDTDGDGIPDARDLDSDGDGITDINESGLTPAQIAALDTDGDGIIDQPVGANGLADGVENTPDSGNLVYTVVDTDNDGAPDFQDLDSDNDGISDLTEGSGLMPSLVDTNNDGVLDDNLTASDSDGDGVPDSIDPTPGSFGGVDQTPVDTDLDGTPDYQDLDSDNDGIHDLVENGLLDPAIVDTNNDGLIDPGVDGDNDGVPDVADTDAGNYGTPQSDVPADTDSDGTPDYQDLDSDNDSIHDLVESGNIDPTVADTDNDGILDDPTVDADGDGIPDSGDTNDGAFGDPQAAPLVDSDGDGVPDVQDLDSDNDSVNDIEEGGNAAADTNGNGMADDPLVDADGDGVPDSIDDAPNTLGDPDSGTAPDSDGEGTPDYIDVDSDDPTDQSGDGAGDDIDIAGNGGLDADGNGTVDDTADPDGDGIPVGSDGAPNNYGELADLDGDGVEDSLDLDDDNDGIPDAVEGTGDTDGDGIPDARDLDSDGDGITDINESGLTPAQIAALDTDGDGIIDQPVGANGLADGVENTPDSGNLVYTVVDTDNDGAPDFQDLDSDNDGLHDLVEGSDLDPAVVDTNNDGVVDDSGASDSDGDGLSDLVDTDDGNFGGLTQTPDDSDGDGMPDFQDADADGDGVPDLVESGLLDPAVVDTNNDGMIDAGPDADGDGVPDIADADGGASYGDDQPDGDPYQNSDSGQPNGDTIPDYLDTDDDGDGVPSAEEDIDGDGDPTNDDTDGDGIPNYLDPDDDGDGVPSAEEDIDGDGNPVNDDTDKDGTPNYLDPDDDGDGLDTLLEDTDGDGDVENDDADGDGIPNYLDPDLTVMGNFVWHDLNGDGMQDSGEPALAGVTVTLRSAVVAASIAPNTNASMVTDSSGIYGFYNLAPGNYFVEFVAPDGLVSVIANVGNDAINSDAIRVGLTDRARTDTIAMANGEQNYDLDAGFTKATGFSSFVFNDANENGVKEKDETFAENVEVILLDASGQEVDRAVTDESGGYTFSELTPNAEYTIRTVLPDNTKFNPDGGTILLQAGLPGERSDGNGTPLLELKPTAVNLSVFTVELRNENELVIRWTTTAEFDTAGFYMLRSSDGTMASARQVTNQLTPSLGSNGGSYELVLPYDETVEPPLSLLSFWLHEVEVGGGINTYGPATVDLDAADMDQFMFLPFLSQ